VPFIVDGVGKGLLAQATGDDILFIWLKDQSKTKEAVKALSEHEREAHIERVLSGITLQLLCPDPQKDSRSPDIVVEPEFGVIYATPTFTGIAEHGDFVDEDRHVALLIANPALGPQEVHAAVGTPQIAPTILRLLGLDPNSLQAVKIEKTEVLPGLW
jgi:hypothetical protein